MPMSPQTKQTVLASLLAMIIPTIAVIGGTYTSFKLLEQDMTEVKDDVSELSDQLNRSSLQSGIWSVLSRNTQDLVSLKTRMDGFDEISKPEEIRYWGYVKQQVPSNESDIKELQSETTLLRAHVDVLREDNHSHGP